MNSQSYGLDIEQDIAESLERVQTLSGRRDSSTVSEASTLSKKKNVICGI
jgi:hypothetical protein